MRTRLPLYDKQVFFKHYWRFLLLVLFTFGLISEIRGQTCSLPGGAGYTPCSVQYEVTFASLSKCGYDEYDEDNPANPPRIAVYHHQEIISSHKFQYNEYTTNGYLISGGADNCWDIRADNGDFTHNTLDQMDFTEEDDTRFHIDSPCFTTNNYVGSDTHDDEVEDSRNTTHIPNGGCDTCSFATTYDHTHQHVEVTPAFIDGSWYSVIHSTETDSALGQTGCDGPVDPSGSFDVSSTNSGVSVLSYADRLDSVSKDSKSYSISNPRNAPGSDYTQSETASQTWKLTYEYTDDELRGNIISLYPPYNTWLDQSFLGADLSDRCAFSAIGGDHKGATLQKMKYRLTIPGGSANTTYKVTYDMITWDISDGGGSSSSMSITFSGTPDESGTVCSPEQFVDAPPFTDNDAGGIKIIWIENAQASIVSGGNSAAGNVSALGIGAGNSTGCSTCGGSGASPNGAHPMLSAAFSLGNPTNGFASNPLQIIANQPSLSLATPAALIHTTNDPELEVIESSGSVRQVTSPQAFCDIVTNDAFSYEIRYYLPSQRGSKSGGLYSVSGSPFVTWKVENPDASTNTYNRLRLTETRGSDSKEYDYKYNGTPTNNVWTLDYPGGLREDEMGTTVIATNNDLGGPSYLRFETNIVRAPGGPDAFKTVRVYEQLGFSPSNGFDCLIQETIDPDNNPKTTTYTYDEGRIQYGFKTLQRVVHPGGNWEYYDSYDSLNRPGRIFSGFGDMPAPTSTPDFSQCKYTLCLYGPLTSDDDGTRFPYEARTATAYIKNNAVSTRFMIAKPGERDDIECPNPGSSYDDPGNLVTVTKYFTNGVNLDRVQSVERPDGTMSIYEYHAAADGSQTNLVYTGQPNTGKTAIIDGTEDVTVLGPVGQMISQTEIDIASSIVTLQDVYGNYDSLDRPQQVTHLDGTTDQTQYACCGVDNTTDRDGVVTQYLYDAMKRQVGSTRLNITTTNVLDAVGRTLETIRVGSDNSQIVMSQASYDVAGQQISQTNALNGKTSFTHTTNSTTGANMDVTVNPDGGIITNLYYVDGSLKETVGSGVHGSRYEYSPGDGYTTTTEIKLNSNGSDTAEAVTNYTDAVGNGFKTICSDGATSQSFHNGLGQLWKTVDPDGVATLYQYSGKGEQEYTAIDMDRNDTIDFDGTDRITRTVADVATDNGTNVRRTRTYVWSANGSSVSNLVSTSEGSVDGLSSWQIQYRDASTPVISQSVTVYSTGGNRYGTNISPDGSYTVSAYLNGRLASVTQKDSSGGQLSAVSYAYDAHGRQYSSTDARNGATTYSYNNADLISSLTTPSPGNGGAAQTTTTYYDTSLRATNVVNADGGSVITEYLPTGELQETYGSRTYPVAYTYDYAGRIKTMKTWQNFAGNSGTATTTWAYDGSRGFLTNKTYDGGTRGPGYTYTSDGRLATRTWARGITTTYNYDNAGGLTNIAYSDGITSSVTNTYDRLGRTIQVGTANLVTQYSYNSANQLLVETNTAGILSSLAVTNGYDAYLRRTDLSAVGAGILSHAAYAYDAGSRLSTVSDGTNNATYTYVANSPLVSQIVFKSNSVTAMITTKSYDYLNRLTQISNAPSASPAVTFNYGYNNANERTKTTLIDSSYWVYQYDSLGQVASGKKYWVDGTPVSGQQFEYNFDDIGNRTQTKSGGDEAGSNLRLANYTNNSLNQLTSQDVPGYMNITGIALATNTVTVSGQSAYRKGEYFRKELSLDNTSCAVWTNITVSSPGQTSIVGNKFHPKTPEAYGYDADGNMTNDGRWIYTWDGENRLVQMRVNTNVGPQYQITFVYDSKGRRVEKSVLTNSVGIYTNRYVYDGWNLIEEMAPNSSIIRSYLWGADLSGGLDGAGGIGGLLAMSSGTTNCFFGYDGNGNVDLLVNATGTRSAVYEYGPFGEIVRATGPLANVNPFRFSSKFRDDESDLIYYGYRYYDPSTGKWLNSDPIKEIAFQKNRDTMVEEPVSGDSGDLNLFAFVNNRPTMEYDSEGLSAFQLNITFGRVDWQHSCGGWRNEWNVHIGGLGSYLVWFVQQVTFTEIVKSCGGKTLPDVTWWEAYNYNGDQIAADIDQERDHPQTTGAAISVVLSTVYPDQAPYSSDITSWKPYGQGYRTFVQPTWWSLNHQPKAFRISYSAWSCCCTSPTSTFGHFP